MRTQGFLLEKMQNLFQFSFSKPFNSLRTKINYLKQVYFFKKDNNILGLTLHESHGFAPSQQCNRIQVHSVMTVPIHSVRSPLPFRSLSYPRDTYKESCNRALSGFSVRGLHSSGESHKETQPLPRLFYVQNPLIWATNKMDFRFLRNKWDPQFTEAEFHRGCRQAISTITHLISRNMFDSLKPMLTKHAMLSLRRDVEILWADEVRRNIALRPEEVQLIIPRKVHFRSLANKRLCDIDMVFIGLKWIGSLRMNPQLLFVDIIARFHRNYSDNIINPEWTVSAFRVRRFNILPNKSIPQ